VKDHKMKAGSRSIPYPACAQRGCKFYGKPAAQGVCFHVLPHKQQDYIGYVMGQARKALEGWKALRNVNKLTSTKAWADFLEGQFVANWATRTFDLDQIVFLRAELAKAQLKLKTWKG
jgi:hypothetical protein